MRHCGLDRGRAEAMCQWAPICRCENLALADGAPLVHLSKICVGTEFLSRVRFSVRRPVCLTPLFDLDETRCRPFAARPSLPGDGLAAGRDAGEAEREANDK
jgi:hypothetical protein